MIYNYTSSQTDKFVFFVCRLFYMVFYFGNTYSHSKFFLCYIGNLCVIAVCNCSSK